MPDPQHDALAFLTGPGEMRQRIRDFDWSTTALGPIDTWPDSLKLSLRMMLNAQHPMLLTWRPEFLLFYNDAARALFGSKHPDAFGQRFQDALPEAWEGIRHQAESMLRTGPTAENTGFRFSIKAEGRPEEPARSFVCSLLPDDHAGVGGMLCIFAGDAVRPRGEPRRALPPAAIDGTVQPLVDSEARLRAFTRATTDVVYRVNADWSAVLYVDGRHFVADTTQPDADWFRTYVHPDEHPRLRREIERALRSRSLFELELRVIRLDGTIGWAYSRAVPILDSRGDIVEWFGAAVDITQRKEAEQALRVSEMRYRMLFNSIDEGYCIIRILFDDAGHAHDYVFEEVNEAFERHTGIRNPEGRSMRSIVPGHEDRWYAAYGRVALTGVPERFVDHATALGRWYDVYAFRIGKPEAHQVAVLFTDISHRRLAEDALRDSEERLRKIAGDLARADRRKDEFLAMLAHELRGPLAPISNMIQLLKTQEVNRETVALARRTMERQLSQLVRLVDDLLDVNRVTRDRLELRKERVELAEVIAQAVEGCRPLGDGFHHRLEVTLPPEPIYLFADPVRMVQIFGNLVNNACKYTDPDGHITLTAERSDGIVTVRVRDTGIGIPPDRLESIFELFTQVDRSLDRAQGGLGIGLTLVKRLVELHEGTVEVRSEGPGKGSEFTVRLPVLAGAPMEMPVPPSATIGAARPRRILVVDDNRDAAESLAMLLEGTGHEVSVAYDGEQALDLARQWRPVAVLLDLGLPKVSGFEVARRIREESWGAGVHLIALSGWGQEEDMRKSQAAGFDAHMVKPPDFVTLLARLESLTGELSPRA